MAVSLHIHPYFFAGFTSGWGGFIGVAESGDDFTKFSTIYQWFQTLIDPAVMQRR
ncbi:hypothetical protein RintRC_0055 [Richelia intracellularis]|nr:hypothetical protein RintRC_0055 [Richelia intracellularis]